MDTGVPDFFNKKLILDYYFCLKSGPVFLFQMFIIVNPHLPFGQHISVSTLVIWPKKNQKLVGVKGAYLKHSFNVRHEEKMKYMLGVSIYCLRVYSFTIWLWYCSGDVLFLCFSLFICRPCAYFYVFHCISVYFALLVGKTFKLCCFPVF
jgi:hypothetical protein